MTLSDVGEFVATLQEWARRSRDRERLSSQCLASACRYARLRSDWYCAAVEERAGMDAARRAAHDAFIADCNALSRAMGDPANRWRRTIGDVREELGDFACLLHAALGLAAR